VARRSYNQYCTLAEALDVVGERWTLLVVRELMLGPRRFSELLHNLPGIGKNLLSARLRHLEDEGLVARRAEGTSHVYELTEEGTALAPAMAELARWGLRRLGPYRPERTFRAAWAMFPLSYTANQEAARGIHETWEFRIDDETFHLRVADGAVSPAVGAAPRPDLVVTMDADTLLEMFSGTLAAVDAVSQGRVSFDGPPEVLEHALAVLAGDASGSPRRSRS